MLAATIIVGAAVLVVGGAFFFFGTMMLVQTLGFRARGYARTGDVRLSLMLMCAGLAIGAVGYWVFHSLVTS